MDQEGGSSINRLEEMMHNKSIMCLVALLTFLLVSNCYSIKEISLEEFKKNYNYPSANHILYYGESNLDNDEDFEKVIVVLDGEYSFTKLLIAKNNKIIASIEISEPYSKILDVHYKDILSLGYNQIVTETSFETYDRGLGQVKALSITSYVDGRYKEIFYHEIENEYRDSFDGWTKYVKWNYSITSGKNAKIVITNIKKKISNANVEPLKLDKEEEYIWDGSEFKRTN